MSKHFKQFLKYNQKNRLPEYPKKILIIDRSRDFQTILMSIFSIALGGVKKMSSIILSNREEQRSINIFKSFWI